MTLRTFTTPNGTIVKSATMFSTPAELAADTEWKYMESATNAVLEVLIKMGHDDAIINDDGGGAYITFPRANGMVQDPIWYVCVPSETNLTTWPWQRFADHEAEAVQTHATLNVDSTPTDVAAWIIATR